MGEISHYWSRPFCRSGKKWYLWVWSRGLQYSIILLCCTFLSLIAQTVMHCTCTVLYFANLGPKSYNTFFCHWLHRAVLYFYQFGKEMIFMGSMERVPNYTALQSSSTLLFSTALLLLCACMICIICKCPTFLEHIQCIALYLYYDAVQVASCSALWWNEFQAETALLLPKLQRQ